MLRIPRLRLGMLGWALVVSLTLVPMACAQSGTYDWGSASDLYPGIKHVKVMVTSPRKMNINCMRIDTAAPGLKFYTTPRCDSWVENSTETQRKTTRQFIRESRSTDRKVVVAINAAAFSPSAPWNEETLTDLRGLAVCEGMLVSPGSGTPSLLVGKNGTATMATTKCGHSISAVQMAVSGFYFVLTNGSTVPGETDPHPRTGIGLSQDSRYVCFMTIDGRRAASAGATTEEVGHWLKHFGSYTGINMDGGGSTTMAWWNPSKSGTDKSELLNSPVGTGAKTNWRTTERCNGNSIGVYYTVAP